MISMFCIRKKKWNSIERAGKKRSCSLNWMVRVSFVLKGIFEQSLEGIEEIRKTVIRGKSILRVRTGRSKSLK